MTRVHPNRVIEDRALNRVTSLFQEARHIVHKIDGRNDFGEDLYISFVADGQFTGETIAVQVKGGRSYRSARGYRVPVGAHDRSWSQTNVPVVCVVYDPDTDKLYWVNASEQLRAAKIGGRSIRSVSISVRSVLDDHTVAQFIEQLRMSIAARSQVRNALSALTGHRLDTTDYLAYFMNEHGEELVFRQRRGKPEASLLHSDYDWEPIVFDPDVLTGEQRAARLGIDTVRDLAASIGDAEMMEYVEQNGDTKLATILDQMPVLGGRLIVSRRELRWIQVCAENSEWWRLAPTGT
ncbi:DUF4365 domain-containing protein [Nocardia brasiliensis]|uniref:DUF4365 domain-containing protein n=1 Tax=Nocardia brasiliensis TaxID=37326 RepID=UPI0036719752